MSNHFHSYWNEDANEPDLLTSRYFYEMMQSYRHCPVDAAEPFEAIKTMLRIEMEYQRHAARAEALREAAEPFDKARVKRLVVQVFGEGYEIVPPRSDAR